MAADTNGKTGTETHIRTHTKDYSKFINMLKWATVAVAIVAAIVIYVISN
ncbi:aa3-type cytochrome c oxidase subunit IV [Sphingomonas sp.]|nr:aa3-type cytochrome c oxidase subunit IV [Sphingomonas sp.]